jgi:transposase
MASSIRKDIDAVELYKRAKQEKNGKIKVRYLAIGALLEGRSREDAAKIAGINIRNLHVWIKRYNEQGLDGLKGGQYLGRQSTWTPEIEQFLKNQVLEGACFEVDKRVTYRLEDFQLMIKEKFDVEYALSTIWYVLKRLGLSWISVRKKHPKTDPAAQEEFKKKSMI